MAHPRAHFPSRRKATLTIIIIIIFKTYIAHFPCKYDQMCFTYMYMYDKI